MHNFALMSFRRFAKLATTFLYNINNNKINHNEDDKKISNYNEDIICVQG